MIRRLWTPAVACSLALAACTSGKSDTPTNQGPPGPAVLISASSSTVVANGTNTVTLTVTNTGSSSVTVTTDHGTFQGAPAPGTTVTVSGASAQVTLLTCSFTTAGCTGVATITGTSAGATTGQATVNFQSPAVACAANCAVDPSCPGQACTPSGGGSGTCSGTSPSACTTSSGGGGGGGGGGVVPANGVTVTPTRTRLPANGTATTTVVVTVMSGTSPVPGAGVSLAASLGTIDPPVVGTTGADGTASFTYTASAAPGTATLTASTTAAPVQTGTATITMPALGRLQLASTGPNLNGTQFAVQGVMTSGWNEFGFLQVQVLDAFGLPYPDGLAVVFEHQPLGGSTLADPAGVVTTAGCAVSGFSPCVTDTTPTTSGSNAPDSQGLANTWVYSGTLAGLLQVVARATVNGVTSSITMPTVAVVGAKASARHFTIVCSPENVPALAYTDCSHSLVDTTITCEAILGDRFGNVLGRPTQVGFMAEAGLVGPPVMTPAYDPQQAPPSTLGTALETISTMGGPLPQYVTTVAGEPYWVNPSDACPPSATNPGRIHSPRQGAVTIIAYTQGEEDFFDTNENGVWDPGEPFVAQGDPFVDANDNGQWDPGEDYYNPNNAPYQGPGTTWKGNTTIWTQTVVVYTGTPTTIALAGPPTTYLGNRWADATFVNACTPSTAPAQFSLNAQQAGPPIVPPSTQRYYVVASDENLNKLSSPTTYSVAVANGSITDVYWGFPQYQDTKGFDYRYWPCGNQGTGTCAAQCNATGDTTCWMMPSLTNFRCGITAPVDITGGSAPDAGLDSINWTVDTPYKYDVGASTDIQLIKALSGHSN